jgi:glycerol-3-phosphate dehydrogenase
MKTREEALRTIEGKSFDVCVIGGGATGSGCALDSQLRGLKTVQLEANDFASSASSASTKMVHGGVRYLQNAIRNFDLKEFLVLQEALRERVHMLRNAPFLTNTRMFLTPCFNWLDIAYFSTGLKLYDWIAGRDGLAKSIFISKEEALRRMPPLASKGLRGAVVYADGQFDDARFNITLVETFSEAGGEPLNYAKVVAFEKSASGKLATAIVEDAITRHSFPVHARCFVNATGASADKVRTLAQPASRPRIRWSKGVHIVLPREVLGSGEALLIPKTEDGRVLFAIPWSGSLLVGTTDEEINSLDDVHLQANEVDYLLRHLNRFLTKPVTAGQILSGFAGVRPLLTSRHSTNTKKLARKHEVEVAPQSGLISIMGGKWTTYRAMAQDAIDAAQEYLNVPVSKCPTLDHPLAGSQGFSPDYWQSLQKLYAEPEAAARQLAQKFGTRASDVMELAKGNPQSAGPIAEGQARLRAEVRFTIRTEMAVSIEDIMARRLGIQSRRWRAAIQGAPAVADILASELGWSEMKRQEALVQYVSKIRGLMQEAGLAREGVDQADQSSAEV